jgi:hypothetical protein
MHILDFVKRQLIKIRQRVADEYQSDQLDDEIISFGVKTDSVQLSKWWYQGIPNIDDVMCGSRHPKSTRLEWFGMDNEEEFDKKSAPHNKWHYNKDNVRYSFNSLGYRGDEPDTESDFTVMIVGDSHGFGIGLDDEEVWAHQFKLLLRQQYPNCKVINLSCPGGSNDWIGRTVSCAIDTLKPDCVIVCYTYANRREAIWDAGLCIQLNTTIPDNPVQSEYEEFQSWFMTINEHTDRYNLMRNQYLVEKSCHSTLLIESHVTQMQLTQRGLGTVLGYTDVARDCQHFGPKVHKEYARKMYQKFCTLQNSKQKVK